MAQFMYILAFICLCPWCYRHIELLVSKLIDVTKIGRENSIFREKGLSTYTMFTTTSIMRCFRIKNWSSCIFFC